MDLSNSVMGDSGESSCACAIFRAETFPCNSIVHSCGVHDPCPQVMERILAVVERSLTVGQFQPSVWFLYSLNKVSPSDTYLYPVTFKEMKNIEMGLIDRGVFERGEEVGCDIDEVQKKFSSISMREYRENENSLYSRVEKCFKATAILKESMIGSISINNSKLSRFVLELHMNLSVMIQVRLNMSRRTPTELSGKKYIQYFKSKKNFDITFACLDGKEVKAHKQVVKKMSGVLAVLCGIGGSSVNIDYRSGDVKRVVRWIYTGDYPRISYRNFFVFRDIAKVWGIKKFFVGVSIQVVQQVLDSREKKDLKILKLILRKKHSHFIDQAFQRIKKNWDYPMDLHGI